MFTAVAVYHDHTTLEIRVPFHARFLSRMLKASACLSRESVKVDDFNASTQTWLIRGSATRAALEVFRYEFPFGRIDEAQYLRSVGIVPVRGRSAAAS